MKHAIAIMITASAVLNLHAGLDFRGSADKIIDITPAASTGLENIYVIRNTDGVFVSVSSAANVKWSRFSANGAAYAEELGYASSIALNDADAGYIAEYDGRAHYFWIVNYANHPLSLEAVEPASIQSSCDRTELEIKGLGERIVYYTINGRSEELSRGLTLEYNSLEFDADNMTYRPVSVCEDVSYIRPVISVTAPFCDTRFTLSGDRFLEQWQSTLSVESQTMTATALSAETTAEQVQRDVDNEQRVDDGTLGGSAPCEIQFRAAVTDAAEFYEWQLSRSADFESIDDRYPQTELDYTFRDNGTTYVRFFAANASAECQYIGQSYEVSIGESALLCPNAFTPESTPGVNDEWKVSYKSIISFECHIFNRWGAEMCSFTDPAIGWDGKYKGKYVPAGVYYYVIKARGADGREYNLSGDINIIKSKDINSTSAAQ